MADTQSPHTGEQVTEALERCATCDALLLYGYTACDETMRHYCENCWPAIRCEELHGEGCSSRCWFDADERTARVNVALSEARQTISDALMDSQYLAGVTAGWNAAQADDPSAALARLQASRNGHLVGFTKAKATLARLTTAARQPVTSVAEEWCAYMDEAVSKAPEPLRNLGEYLGSILDEDRWKTAERLLNAAVLAAARQPEAMADQSTEARLRELEKRLSDARAQSPHEPFSDDNGAWNAGFCEAWMVVRAALSFPVQDTSDELTRLRAEVEAMRGLLLEAVDYVGGVPVGQLPGRKYAHKIAWGESFISRARTTLNGEQANGG